MIRNTKSTWGKPLGEVGRIGRDRFLKLHGVINMILTVALATVILSNGAYISYKLFTTEFEELVFDDGTPIKCILNSSSNKPIPSILIKD